LAPSSARSGLPVERVEQWLRDGRGAAASDPLLLTLLESAVIPDPAAEAVLTTLRRALLLRIEAPAAQPEIALPLVYALAQHCFVNEYVFVESPDETAIVDRLRRQLEDMLAEDALIPEFALATLAAYTPLHKVAGAERLLSHERSPAFARLVDRQISEPLEEARLQAELPRLTPIDASSAEIHAQYESNPYPRWVKISSPTPTTLHDALRTMFPQIALPSAGPATPDILIAGCGTGQHAIETALRFTGSRVLAVDLSIASLAYALRKTRELALATLDYAQADILELGRVGRAFDVIEAVGVLHHMDDPIAGWRVLASLLRPGAVMKIGLYSARARAHIVRVRQLIAERGYGSTAEDVRRFRQELLTRSDGDARRLIESPDFYSVSSCRDLLFNVREHHVGLPEIAQTLAASQLAFLGFEVADEVKRAYRARHPGDPATTDLGRWDEFESEHPEIFRGMYQFWVRRR